LALVRTDVSEELISSIIKREATRTNEQQKGIQKIVLPLKNVTFLL
jgi:hypothetical protein